MGLKRVAVRNIECYLFGLCTKTKNINFVVFCASRSSGGVCAQEEKIFGFNFVVGRLWIRLF